jgi:hypothetical protein
MSVTVATPADFPPEFSSEDSICTHCGQDVRYGRTVGQWVHDNGMIECR